MAFNNIIKKEVEIKTLKYCRKNIQKTDFTNLYWKGTEHKGKILERYELYCPCCGYCVSHDRYPSDSDNDFYYSFFNCNMKAHMEYHIRMNACPKHLKFMIKIYGLESSLLMIDKWATKNIIIGCLLRQLVLNLTKDTGIAKQSSTKRRETTHRRIRR